MRIALLFIPVLTVLASAAGAGPQNCMPTVSPGQPKWTTCVPDKLQAPRRPKTTTGVFLFIVD